jgi:hypothetical protein
MNFQYESSLPNTMYVVSKVSTYEVSGVAETIQSLL